MSKARVEADEHIEAICKYLCETSSIGPFLCAVYYPGLVSRCIPLCTWVLQFFLLVLLASWFNGEDAAEYGSLHSTVHESEDNTSLATQYLPSWWHHPHPISVPEVEVYSKDLSCFASRWWWCADLSQNLISIYILGLLRTWNHTKPLRFCNTWRMPTIYVHSQWLWLHDIKLGNCLLQFTRADRYGSKYGCIGLHIWFGWGNLWKHILLNMRKLRKLMYAIAYQFTH